MCYCIFVCTYILLCLFNYLLILINLNYCKLCLSINFTEVTACRCVSVYVFSRTRACLCSLHMYVRVYACAHLYAQ